MDHSGHTANGRRTFITDTFKVVVLGAVLGPMTIACKSNNDTRKAADKKDGNKPTGKGSQPNRTRHKDRKQWTHEKLVMNTKTKVVHFPTARQYHYYDEIKAGHLQEISLAAWASTMTADMRFNRERSGNILEILAMNDLSKGIDTGSLTTATQTLSRAFAKDMTNSKGIHCNMYNFRVHELLLQLISLNESIPLGNKWQTFGSMVVKPPQLRKRQQWMSSEADFNERVRYIIDHQNEYLTRLQERASRYRFT